MSGQRSRIRSTSTINLNAEGKDEIDATVILGTFGVMELRHPDSVAADFTETRRAVDRMMRVLRDDDHPLAEELDTAVNDLVALVHEEQLARVVQLHRGLIGAGPDVMIIPWPVWEPPT